MLIIRLADIYSVPSILRPKMYIEILVVALIALLIFSIFYFLSNPFYDRIMSAYDEIHNRFSGGDLVSSIGIRLTVWHISFQLAVNNPLFGYGEQNIINSILQNSSLNTATNAIPIYTLSNTGPHSDILSKMLSAGLFGLTAYLALIFVPFYFFWKHRNAVHENNKNAARIGIYYILGVFIAGLTNEQLSLKYLCTFYGLMIATLLAQVLYQPTPKSTVGEVDRIKPSARFYG